MIDITPYQHKLTWLQEWIELRIDKRILFVIIQHMYETTGQLMYIHHSEPAGWDFEVYCAYRQQQEANVNFITN